MATDYSGFEGHPSHVTVRGQVAVRAGSFVGTHGHLSRKPTHF